ncbi:hypothetical protein [Lacunimicrobium album]
MAQFNRFVVRNDFAGLLLLSIEPEGAMVSLSEGEEVRVNDEFENEPVTLNVSMDQSGSPVIAVWPGDGSVRVEKGGVNVLDLG